MSSKPAKKASESSAATKKKRTASKKASSSTTGKKVGKKTTTRKKAARTSTPKKKAAARKTSAKKTASRKTTGKKATSRKASAKKASTSGAPVKDTATETETATDTAPKSISWMSEQASSALKAVKANQAVKGQAVLAKNKKQDTRQPIDDASLIEIAAGMPVDDAALIEFSTEDSQQEPVMKPETQDTRADSSDAAPESAAQIPTPDKAEAPEARAIPEHPPAGPVTGEQAAATQASMPPPPQSRQQSTRWPAVLAITILAVTLGYVYWSGIEEGTLIGAVVEKFQTADTPAADMTAVSAEPETVTALPSGETDIADEAQIRPDNAPTAVAGDTWEPANMPPVVTPGPAPAAVEPPVSEPVEVAQPVPEPAFAEQAEPAVAEQPAPEPAVVAQPPAAPQPTTPAAAPAATTPAAAPGGYRPQGYGYYPQSRQPAYPPQYYRQYR